MAFVALDAEGLNVHVNSDGRWQHTVACTATDATTGATLELRPASVVWFDQQVLLVNQADAVVYTNASYPGERGAWQRSSVYNSVSGGPVTQLVTDGTTLYGLATDRRTLLRWTSTAFVPLSRSKSVPTHDDEPLDIDALAGAHGQVYALAGSRVYTLTRMGFFDDWIWEAALAMSSRVSPCTQGLAVNPDGPPLDNVYAPHLYSLCEGAPRVLQFRMARHGHAGGPEYFFQSSAVLPDNVALSNLFWLPAAAVRIPVVACQQLSDQFGVGPGRVRGEASAAVLAMYADAGCATFPVQCCLGTSRFDCGDFTVPATGELTGGHRQCDLYLRQVCSADPRQCVASDFCQRNGKFCDDAATAWCAQPGHQDDPFCGCLNVSNALSAMGVTPACLARCEGEPRAYKPSQLAECSGTFCQQIINLPNNERVQLIDNKFIIQCGGGTNTPPHTSPVPPDTAPATPPNTAPAAPPDAAPPNTSPTTPSPTAAQLPQWAIIALGAVAGGLALVAAIVIIVILSQRRRAGPAGRR